MGQWGTPNCGKSKAAGSSDSVMGRCAQIYHLLFLRVGWATRGKEGSPPSEVERGTAYNIGLGNCNSSAIALQ